MWYPGPMQLLISCVAKLYYFWTTLEWRKTNLGSETRGQLLDSAWEKNILISFVRCDRELSSPAWASQAGVIGLNCLDLRLVKGVEVREGFNGCDTSTTIQNSLKSLRYQVQLFPLLPFTILFKNIQRTTSFLPFPPKFLIIVGVPIANGNLCHYEIRFWLPKSG